jgi:hypothetical protein
MLLVSYGKRYDAVVMLIVLFVYVSLALSCGNYAPVTVP